MKKLITMLVLVALSNFAMADGSHGGDHDKKDGPINKQLNHDAHNMSGMSHDHHDADAGQPGDPDKTSRTIQVSMDDTMRFVPNQLNFKAGETVRFVVRNIGKIRHEMVIGSVTELKEHAEMMRDNPMMQHTDPNMISLAPGEQSELVWQFDQPGSFDFACLIPGHLEAGMTGKIKVD